ncbi:MAG TPA: FAD-dependent oxidoreductase [Candidatus Hypogeohydataceae bacterium YC41]
MMKGYEVVVIGSGFGGAVTAYELAKKGYKVCILERGPQWTSEYFPGSNKQDLAQNLIEILGASQLNSRGVPFREIIRKADLLHVMEKLEKPSMWEYRAFDRMDVLTGNGVGGGSLVYANVLHRAHKEAFEKWPGGIDWSAELEQHYSEVEQKIGTNIAICDKSRALKKASEKSGRGKWDFVHLAIQRPHPQMATAKAVGCSTCHYGEDAPEKKEACELENERSYCMSCGRCVLGCKRLNRYTLDLNYIRDAVRHYGAHLYPNHEVTKIKPITNAPPFNYLILCDNQQRAFKAQKVVIAAGSLGSTKLLLRCKDDPDSLPNLSDKLGERFSGNGDFQGFAYNCDVTVNSSVGPTITSEVDFNPVKSIIVEEGGIPDVLAPFAAAFVPKLGLLQQLKELTLADFVDLMSGQKKLNLAEDVTEKSMMYLCMGRAEGYGRIELSDAGDVNIVWPDSEWNKLKAFTQGLIKELEALTAGLGGEYFSLPLWEMGKLATVHPIGGCSMAQAKEEGVVKPNGEVFGYDNLYVADGAIIPASLGVNPSLTIAALAHRIASLIPAKT